MLARRAGSLRGGGLVGIEHFGGRDGRRIIWGRGGGKIILAKGEGIISTPCAQKNLQTITA